MRDIQTWGERFIQGRYAAKSLWDGREKSDGLGPVSLLGGNLMSGLIVSSAISSKQARPDGALHVKSILQS